MIYTNNTFKGRCPVGTAAVVKAKSPQDAANILNGHLKAFKFKGRVTAASMVRFPGPKEVLRILCDGDY